MEAAVSHLIASRGQPAARELEELRPLGQAFLLRRFSGSISAADAEDAVADVVIRLHQRIEDGRPPDNLRAAFFTSVRNAAIDQLRSRASKPTVGLEVVAEAPLAEPGPGERAEGREDSLRLQEVLARMRSNYREAIVLRFGVGLTVPEIAERLAISLPAAKKLILRATEQARKRLIAIEGEQFCPEMQELARRSLFDRQLAGIASEAEQALLRAHLEHCGRCKSFLTGLHRDLHELGSSALILGLGGGRLGLSGHLTRLFNSASNGGHAVAAKMRLASYNAAAVVQPGDGGGAGAFARTAQKVIAVCGAATATTATCLATGVVGPGLGANAASHDSPAAHPPTPIVRAASETPPELPATPSESVPQQEPQPTEGEGAGAEPTPEVEPTPSEQASEEFGFESSAEPAPSAAAESPSSASPESSAAAGSGSGERFGFGG